MLFALFLSNVGTALQLATQAWFVWETSHHPATVGLLGLVQASPLLGIPLLGGILADRFPRRKLLLFTQSILAALSALMGSLALAGLLSLPLTLVLSGLLASVTALDNPMRQVYLPGVVEAAQRSRTVGLNALTYNGGAIAGPALAGIFLPLIGVGWCFLLNALSYLLVVSWLTAGPELLPGRVHTVRKSVLGVGHYVRQTPSVRNLLLLVATVSLLGRSYPTVLPVLVNKIWGGGARTYGTLSALPGIGATIAAVLVIWLLGQQRQKRHGWLGGTLLGVSIVCVGGAYPLVLAGLALLVTGFAATGTMTLLNASLQETTPDDVRGRIMSLYTWLAAGMPALGGWLLGTLMSIVAPQVVLVAAGTILIGVTLLLGQSGSRHLAQSPPREGL